MPLCVFPVLLAGTLAFGQSSAQPNYQPGQQGPVNGGVIQPIDNGQAQPTSAPSGQPQPNQSQQPQAQQPKPGQQGKVDGGVIQPIDDGSQPANAQSPTQQPAQQPSQAQPQQNQQVQPAQQRQMQNGTSNQNAQQPAAPKSPNQPSDTVNVPAQGNNNGQALDEQSNGVFIIHRRVEEVHLNATVVDDRQRLITNLDKDAFTVFENGQQQQITSFRHEDIPVALGVVIDNSGSMRDKRPAVNQATINLVKASNPEDEVFVVNFNDDYYLDQDYTDSVPKLKESLEKYETRGGTALYDAVLASNAHLMKAPKLEKKVLFVVTDGEDDASLNTLEQTIRKVQQENGPTIYTIGILDEQGSHKRRAQRALREMAEATGGVAFFPQSLDEVNRITEQVAHDIRNQYTISYKPTNPQSHGGYRQVKVEARARGYKQLQVRTRTGYYAGQNQSAASPAPAPAGQSNAAVR